MKPDIGDPVSQTTVLPLAVFTARNTNKPGVSFLQRYRATFEAAVDICGCNELWLSLLSLQH